MRVSGPCAMPVASALVRGADWEVSLFSPGARLQGRFTLVALIGLGGMSEVWRATDELLGRPVAVKALATSVPFRADTPQTRGETATVPAAVGQSTAVAADAGQLAASLAPPAASWREARAVARLTHPNVAQLYDYGEVPVLGGGIAGYLVMELVDGETLAARLARGPLPWREAARVVRQVAAALAAAHQRGVVHRDIKPGNVMLTEAGVKVLDFGIASVAGLAVTEPGLLVGTPQYTAPERLEPTATASPAGDVYSLGTLWYESLVGQPLLPPQTWPEVAAAHRTGVPVPPLAVSGLPPELAELCRSCLSADPAQRPTAAQVATGLAAATGGWSDSSPAAEDATAREPGRYAPGSASPPGAWLPPTRVEEHPEPERRIRWGRLAGVGVAMVAVGVSLVLVGTALRPGGTGSGDPGGLGGPVNPPATGVAAPDRPRVTPTGAEQIIFELNRELLAGLESGALTRDGYEDLHDTLSKLRDALAREDPEQKEKKLREAAEDFREEIEELREDGEIAPATADRLTALLEPLR